MIIAVYSIDHSTVSNGINPKIPNNHNNNKGYNKSDNIEFLDFIENIQECFRNIKSFCILITNNRIEKKQYKKNMKNRISKGCKKCQSYHRWLWKEHFYTFFNDWSNHILFSPKEWNNDSIRKCLPKKSNFLRKLLIKKMLLF